MISRLPLEAAVGGACEVRSTHFRPPKHPNAALTKRLLRTCRSRQGCRYKAESRHVVRSQVNDSGDKNQRPLKIVIFSLRSSPSILGFRVRPVADNRNTETYNPIHEPITVGRETGRTLCAATRPRCAGKCGCHRQRVNHGFGQRCPSRNTGFRVIYLKPAAVAHCQKSKVRRLCGCAKQARGAFQAGRRRERGRQPFKRMNQIEVTHGIRFVRKRAVTTCKQMDHQL